MSDSDAVLINIGDYDRTLLLSLTEGNIDRLKGLVGKHQDLDSYTTSVELEDAYVSDWILPDLSNLAKYHDDLESEILFADVWLYQGWSPSLWENEGVDFGKRDEIPVEVQPDRGVAFDIDGYEMQTIIHPRDLEQKFKED